MKRVIMNIVLMSLLLTFGIVQAEEESQYLLTESTYKALNNAQELMAKDKLNEAEAKLKSLLNKDSNGAYDKAIIQQTLGYLYSSREAYGQASRYFKLALDSGALPEKVSHDLRYNLAQLLLAESKFKAGITLLEQWMKKEPSPATSAYVLLASANYQVNNYQKTINAIQVAIKRDKKAQESWYQMLLSAHLELKQYKSAIKVLEKLIPSYPYKKVYWSQLSSLYLQQNKEFTALAVKMLMQRLDLGDGKTLINMADMYRYLRIPYKSAKLLDQAMSDGVISTNYKNLTRLAESWLAARENDKAAAVLQKIIKLDDSGESDLKYARVLFQMESWKQSIPALQQSLTKLQGKKVGAARLLLGMTHYHLGHLSKAKTWVTILGACIRQNILPPSLPEA